MAIFPKTLNKWSPKKNQILWGKKMLLKHVSAIDTYKRLCWKENIARYSIKDKKLLHD